MAERKLPMGAKEIVASYRTAKNPKAQIGVLADLNGCTEQEIEEVLMQLGAIKPAERKKPNPRKINVDAAAARELLEQGMTDEEAAAALDIGVHKFAEWRREAGIKPNRKTVVSEESTVLAKDHGDGECGKNHCLASNETADSLGDTEGDAFVTVGKLYNILTAALAGKMGHAAVTVKGQRFRSMALRISYPIGGEEQGPTAELVAEPLE